MVGILDNKKIAELVITQDGENYEKINPQTLATIVEDVTKSNTSEEINATVQEHIDNKDIHLDRVDILNITSDCVRVDKLIPGQNITIEQDSEENVIISAGNIKIDSFLTGDDIIPEDSTITITPIEDSNKINIRANIPDVSKMVEQENIKSGNENIHIDYDAESNDVIISGFSEVYKAGYGIKITDDNEVINTYPDKVVNMTAGKNVTIEGTYPDFKISANENVKIEDWLYTTYYKVDDIVVYNNSLFRCIENHTSAYTFDTSKWKLIAGWSAQRQFFEVNDDSNVVTLNEVIPNKDVLIINIGGVLQQSQNYELQADGKTISFINPLPKETIIEVMVMSNVVLDTYDSKVNIEDWKSNISFAEGNLCLYNNGIYQCLERHISGEEFEQEKWKAVCGYAKSSHFFHFDEEVSQIELPVIVFRKDNLMVNVGNTLLQSNCYELSHDGKVLTFVEPLEANCDIEITVLSEAVMQCFEIPTPSNKPFHMLVSNVNGDGYDLYNKEEVNELLGFSKISTFTDNENKYIAINEDATDYKVVAPVNVSGDVYVRNIINGLHIDIIEGEKEVPYVEIKNKSNDKFVIKAGSVLSSDGKIMIVIPDMIKNPTEPFKNGNDKGCMIGIYDEEWNQPLMTSNTTPTGRIVTNEAQTDYEGYRVMDGLGVEGNGWFVNNTTANWEYELPYEVKIESFDFYNTLSGTLNYSKNIDFWIGNPENVVVSFEAVAEDFGHSHVEIPEPVYSNKMGFHIIDSYGTAVGSKEIKFNGSFKSCLLKNSIFNIYAISNDDGSMVDIITALYDESEIANYLPEYFTKYALIGCFRTDDNWKLYDVYPNRELKDSLIDGSINGELYENKLIYNVKNMETNIHETIIEQWGETIPVDGVVTFPKAYNKLMYVMVNGEKIITKSETGFTVDNAIDYAVSWMAKGY